MSVQTHGQTANFIWSICNLLRGPYKRNEYRKVILPAFSPNVRQIFEKLDFGIQVNRMNEKNLLFNVVKTIYDPACGTGGMLSVSENYIRKLNSQWIIENDWLEAIVALPNQLFYNTSISTYIWIVTNRKEKPRTGKIQLIDARQYFVKMRKSLGNKRKQIGDGEENRPDHIAEITKIYGNYQHDETRSVETDGFIKQVIVSKIFDNADFGYYKITVERPLRLNFQACAERLSLLDDMSGFKKIAQSNKKNETIRQQEIEAGMKRQKAIKTLLADLGKATAGKLFKDRMKFLKELKAVDQKSGVRLSAPELKAVLEALGEKDETAEICRDAKGNPAADPDLRDKDLK